jgi:hypothetical protein
MCGGPHQCCRHPCGPGCAADAMHCCCCPVAHPVDCVGVVLLRCQQKMLGTVIIRSTHLFSSQTSGHDLCGLQHSNLEHPPYVMQGLKSTTGFHSAAQQSADDWMCAQVETDWVISNASVAEFRADATYSPKPRPQRHMHAADNTPPAIEFPFPFTRCTQEGRQLAESRERIGRSNGVQR